ncbi:Membrane protein involved in the export of O-antigen and teichoic acid [Prevotella sp. tc2-28]|jgi:O-antigen/teichoic acid export membrane protein|uniref:oligosaccharide flippase family protein n=1 Tax=Prevotella sp. tc2-28 TaxID=1761888 RepID=UPI00089574FF|nr:lipopolysaccharide biosynthesis protein [Prevotella sp. tc2-28]SEA66386.1 Membrane protein involved in the export of O-antigen and teichoic acid [Prevotella sp. tc2-28]
MGKLTTIFKDTAIYGLSSIIGRFLNYLLVPLYTAQFSAASGAYGIITNIYAYVALAMVLLTFGMETTYFRFTNKTHTDSETVYGTTLITVGSISLVFAVLVLLLLSPISQLMGYGEHPDYVGVMAVTIAIDAFLCIPFAHLRQQRKAIKFAALKLLNIMVTILLNLIYFYFMDGKDVGYVFYINLACTVMLAVCLITEYTGFRWKLDKVLLRNMLSYSWPILILGIAGILNQTADKMLFPYIYEGSDMRAQLGIYGACSKIAMIMAMITQAFRFAYEPIVFAGVKDKDQHEMYTKTMKFFIIFTLLAFLIVVGYMDLLKYIVRNPDYWVGLKVVPIVMAAEIMMGIYFNLSFWYKIIDKTIWGAIFSGIGCAVLLAVNIIFVPKYGFMACAWGGFAGYGVAMLASYFVGQKYYPLKYPIKEIVLYVVLAYVLFRLMDLSVDWPMMGRLAFNTLLILIFVAVIVKFDLPLGKLPVIGKYFR